MNFSPLEEIMSRFLPSALVGLSILSSTACTPRDSSSAPKTSQPPTETSPPPTNRWAPDSMYLDKLDSPFDVGGYRIRPPKGFTLNKSKTGGSTTFIWQGPARSDKSTPKLWVIVGRMGPGEEKMSLEETNAILIGAAKRKMDDYTATPVEHGKIGNLPVIRMTFHGTEKEPPRYKGHTVAYHAHDGQQYIHIMTLDVEPHWIDSFLLLESAARTLEKN